MDDEADGEEPVVPASRDLGRTRSASTDGGPSLGLMIGLGGGAAALVSLVVCLIVFNGGRGSAPGKREELSGDKQPTTPGLLERVADAVTGFGHDRDDDVASYPNPGPLPPMLLPPPPLRDLSQHETQERSLNTKIDRMGDILATVHDTPSFGTAVGQIQTLSDQMVDELRKSPPLFSLTPAEEAELTRRITGDMRRSIERLRRESHRISELPSLGIAGVQLVALINQLSIPAEVAMQRAENLKAPTAPPPYAEIFIQLHDADDAVVFQHKLDEFLADDPEKGIMYATSQRHGDSPRASFRVWPVYDVESLSRQIPFGTASVKGRRIFVKSGPIPTAELAAAKEARQRIQEAHDAAFKAARAGSPDEANDPQPPADADDLTKALFALRSSRPARRKDGANRIARITPTDDRRDEVHKQLEALLTDGDGFLINTVMKAMVQWRTDETVPALIKVLDTPNFGVRWEAEELLGNLGDPRAAEPLAARLKDDDIKVEPALRALGPAAEPALIPLLRDRDPHIRAKACNVLKDVGGKDTLEVMMTLPADPDPSVQVAAREAMQNIRSRVGPIGIPKKSSTQKSKSGKPN